MCIRASVWSYLCDIAARPTTTSQLVRMVPYRQLAFPFRVGSPGTCDDHWLANLRACIFALTKLTSPSKGNAGLLREVRWKSMTPSRLPTRQWRYRRWPSFSVETIRAKMTHSQRVGCRQGDGGHLSPECRMCLFAVVRRMALCSLHPQRTIRLLRDVVNELVARLLSLYVATWTATSIDE